MPFKCGRGDTFAGVSGPRPANVAAQPVSVLRLNRFYFQAAALANPTPSRCVPLRRLCGVQSASRCGAPRRPRGGAGAAIAQ